MINLDPWQKEILKTKGNLCLCSGRQVGKSSIIAIKAGDFACLNQGKSVLIISAVERQAEELFIKVLNYILEIHPRLVSRGKDRPTKKMIRLKNGSVIRCLPTGLAGLGIRGFTIDLLIADEAAFISEDVWAAVTPMLLTTGGDTVLVSTPFGKQGYFYESYNDKGYTTFHIKSEEMIQKREISGTWSAIQREKAIEHLEREKKKMTKLQYLQEYCGEFVDELRQFFPDELIKRCMKVKRGEFIPDKTYFIGVDVARMGEDEATYECVMRSDTKRLTHVESIVTKKNYLTDVSKEVIRLNGIYKFKKIYIDDGGIGVGVFDYLLDHPDTKRKVIAINNRSRPLDKEGEHKKKILKEDLYNNLLGLMERREIDLLSDDNIFQSFKSVQYEYDLKPGSRTKLKIFGKYTHIVEGLIRASWCVRDKSLNIWCR